MPHRLLRITIGILGLFSLLLTLAFYFRWPVTANFWPWTGYYSSLSSLSYYFMSSVAASICAPLLWIALTNKLHTATPGALDLVVSTIGITVYIFQTYMQTSTARLLQAGLFSSGAVILVIIFFILTYKIQGTDKRLLPKLVRYSFYVFVVVLVFAGMLLILNRPNILPWSISKEASVVYGWIFLGASVYFLYATFKNTWDYAAGPLLGFLAYDFVLILPFIQRFSEVPQQQYLSLVIYTLVIVYSALLAIYYLFIHSKTRVFS